MMRTLLILALLASPASPASADDAVRKGASDKFAKAAGEAFKAAVQADKDGDLRAALGLYEKAFAISPTAADKKDVETVIDKLAKTPGMLWVSTSPASDPRAIDLTNAYILVDGEIKKTPGVEIHAGPYNFREGFGMDLRAGDHTVDVVTSVSFGSQTCKFGPGENRECTITAPPRTDGAVVFNSSDRGLEVRVPDKDKNRRRTQREIRFDLPGGKQRLLLRDRSYECPTVPIDVPKGGDLAYVFVQTTEHDRLERCRSVTVVQHRLKF